MNANYVVEFEGRGKVWFEIFWTAVHFVLNNIDLEVKDSPASVAGHPLVTLIRTKDNHVILKTVHRKWDWYFYCLEVSKGLTKEEYEIVLTFLTCIYWNARSWNNKTDKFETPKAVEIWHKEVVAHL